MSDSTLGQKPSEFVTGKQLTTITFIALFSVTLIAYLFNAWHEWRRLSHVPGPFSASSSKLWMAFQSFKRRQPYTFKEANERHGSLVRVGPNEVITNNPEVLRKVMAVRSTYTRGHFYNAMKFDPTRDNLFSMRDEIAHTKLRAKMAAGYSGEENESMEETVDNQVANFASLIEAKYISTSQDLSPLDFGEKASFFTLDVISDLAFGQAFGYLEGDEDKYDYLSMSKTAIPFMMAVTDVPVLADTLQSRFFRWILLSEADKAGFGAFIGIRYHVDAEPRFDMLGAFIRHGLSQDEAAGEALLQIVAGSDTSAGTIRAVILSVVTNALVYRKLQAEIDDAVKNGKVSPPIADVEARDLPYLQAVIKEGLRVMPPASGAMFKQVPLGGDIVDGVFLPGGTQIGESPLGTQHSKSIYGADADLFRPERWTEASAEKAIEMTSSVDLCFFHHGKYECLGKSVAFMEFNKLFVELFRKFDFSVCRSDRPTALSIAGLWIMEDFWLRGELRRGAQ